MQLYITLIKKIEDQHPNMRSLDLISFKGEEQTVRVIIEGNSASSGVYSYDNDFTDRVITAIARVLKTNCTLISLSYSIDRIALATMHALAEALECNHKLRELHLCKSFIGDEGVAILTKSMTKNSFLICVDLGINQIGDEGAIALAQFLVGNQTITQLKLYRNQIGVAGGRALVRALENNQTLVHLNLDGNNINEEDKQAINVLLKRNNEAMLLRRQQFIASVICLACCAAEPKSLYNFSHLPSDVKRYLLRFLSYHGKDNIGKSNQQIYQCAEFIFDNYAECGSLIKQKQRIKLLEKTNGKGECRFAFFKSTLTAATESRGEFEMQNSQRTQMLRIR